MQKNIQTTIPKNIREKKQQITSSTPPIEYFKTRRKADVLSPFDFAVGNTTLSPTTTQKAHETNQVWIACDLNTCRCHEDQDP